MKTKTTKRNVGDVIPWTALVKAGGEYLPQIERDESSVKLERCWGVSRHRRHWVSSWDCTVIGGRWDGHCFEFLVFEPVEIP